MDPSNFVNVSISTSKDFSWVFFVYWFLIFLLSTGMIFYFNRLIGYLFTVFFRFAIEKKYNIKIDIQSVKFSLLAGRIILKNLTIIDKDETISIVHLNFTWRYWIPIVRKPLCSIADQGEPEVQRRSNSTLPCRFTLDIDGFECFVYNRTAAYVSMLNLFQEIGSNNDSDTPEMKPETIDMLKNFDDSDFTDDGKNVQKMGITGCLPMDIRINKGAVIVGNKTTESIVIGSFSSGKIVVDFDKSPSALDKGRMTIESRLLNFNLHLKPNIIFEKGTSEDTRGNFQDQRRMFLERYQLLRPFSKLEKIFRSSNSESSPIPQWMGLSQYLLDDEIETKPSVAHKDQEYAKYTTVATSKELIAHYYYDLPGSVGNDPDGELAPEFGLDISLDEATIHYGPWAERQRTSLYQLMLPSYSITPNPHKPMAPGDERVYTKFVLKMEVVGDLILRVPMREFSKHEASEKRHADVEESQNQSSELMPFAWLELKASEGSLLNMNTGLACSDSGYENNLQLRFLNMELRSSVNHDILLTAKEHLIDCDLSNPLKWNGTTNWKIANESRCLQLFLLEEHITLISDLFTDFASGKPTPYENFRPFFYSFAWKINNYAFHFNLNDANIVNNPVDFNDNIFLSIEGETIDIDVLFPADSIVKQATTADYNIKTPAFTLLLNTPPWHTLNNFLACKEVGRSSEFAIQGSYTYYSEVGIDFVETIIVECKGEHVILECYGFVVKYIMAVRENYFGDFTKFQTLEEYSRGLNTKTNENLPSHEQSSPEADAVTKTKNEVDVHFSFCVTDSVIIVPENIYNCSSNTSLFFNNLDIDIRFTNYYMDMQVNTSPITGFHSTLASNEKVLSIGTYSTSKANELSIDGLAIHGHRMFGNPPDEPTYFCKWDILPGDFLFHGPVSSLRGLCQGLAKLGFGYKNLENHLLLEEPVLYDTTCLNAFFPSVKIVLDEPGIDQKIALDLSVLSFKYTDFVNSRYNERISVDLEKLSLTIEEKQSSEELFSLQTALRFSNFASKVHKDIVSSRQNQHISTHDASSHRVPFMLNENAKDSKYNSKLHAATNSYSLAAGNPQLNKDTVDIIFEDLGIDGEMVDDDDDDTTDPFINAHTNLSDSSNSFCSSSNSSIKFNHNPIDNSHYSNATQKNYYQTITGVNFKTSTDYREEDFMSSTALDDSYEIDSLILNFGDIDCELTVKSLFVLLSFVEIFANRSLTSVLDDLHITVLKKLYNSIKSKSTVVNTRFISPQINIDFCQSSWGNKKNRSFENIDHINVVLCAPSLAGSHINSSEGLSQHILTAHLQTLAVSITQSGSPQTSLGVSLHDLEFWVDSKESRNFSILIGYLDFHISPTHVVWLLKFLDEIAADVSKFVSSLGECLKNIEKSTKELLYQIANGSLLHRVEHDPAVITRPAFIIRLSRKHVRANDSWKVIMRLRHILNNLPPEWVAAHQDNFLNNHFTAPESSMDDVLNVFNEWRSWEFTGIANSFVFNYVFRNEINKDNKLVNLKTSIGELEVSNILVHLLNDETLTSNYVDIRSISVDFTSIPNEQHLKLPFVQSVFLTVHIASLSSRLDTDLLKLLDLSQIGFPQKTVSQNKTKKEEPVVSAPCIHQLFCDVRTCDVIVAMGKTSIEIKGTGFTTSIAVSVFGPSDYSLLFSQHFQTCELVGLSSDERIFSVLVSGSKTDFASVSMDKQNRAQSLSMDNKSAEIFLDCSTGSLVSFIDNLKNDLTNVKKLLPQKLSSEKPSNGPESALHLLDNTTFKSSNHAFKWNLSSIEPLVSKGEISEVSMNLAVFDRLVDIGLSLNGVSVGFKLSGKMPNDNFRIKHDQLDFITQIDLDSKTLDVDVRSSITRFFVIDCHTLNRNSNQITENLEYSLNLIIKSVENLFELTHSEKATAVEPQAKLTQETHWNLPATKVFSEQIILEVMSGEDSLTIEFDNISFEYYNLVLSLKARPYGIFSIGGLRLLVDSPIINPDKSLVFDANLTVQVNNNENDDSQTLQMKTSYLRLMMSPKVILKLLQFADSAKDLSESFASIDLNFKPPGETPENPSATSETKLNSLFKFSSVHMLAYGVCIGFIFEDPGFSNCYGLIAGCEKAFVMSEKSYGKFSIIGAYISTAKGQTSGDFYSVTNEKDELNRAFLPNMQLVYAMARSGNNKNLKTKLVGGELDVQIVSNTSDYIEQIFKAVTLINEGRKTAKIYNTSKVKIQKQKPDESVTDTYRLPEDFTSISCEMDYEGGVFKLIRWEDVQSEGDEFIAPSLELRSPAVKITADYQKKPQEARKHFIKFKTITHSSSNTVHYTCMPVLRDVWKGVKDLVQDIKGVSSDQKESPPISDSSSTQGFDWNDIMSRFHLELALHIDKQELILSCEPSAKVQAVVGIDSFDYTMESNYTESDCPVVGTLELKQISASLQHSFSREISGSIGIDKMLAVMSIDSPTSPEIYLVTKVNKVGSYINLKQIQDLDLFRDLWFPKSFIYTSSESVKSMATVIEGTTNENFVYKFQKVSNSGLSPFILDLSIVDVGLKIDLGQSLGVVSLDLDRFWLTSNSSPKKEQVMTAGFDSIILHSEGRLSGYVEVKDINGHSVINYQNEDPSIIPNVLLSIGFSSVETRVSFDYSPFLIGRISHSSITAFNQLETDRKLNDRIIAVSELGSVEFYITALAASNILDIHNTVMRMVQDSKLSYSEDLQETTGLSGRKQVIADALERIKLCTELDVNVENFVLHIYPGSLFDAEVLVLGISGASSHFQQNPNLDKLENDLKMTLLGINVALSTNKHQLKEDKLSKTTIDEFIKHSRKARGGEIFFFPSFECSMETSMNPQSNEVEYLFNSTFSGKVDIRWNLGSISFIREMWSLHSRALAVRMPKINHDYDANVDTNEIEERVNAIEKKIKDVDIDKKYSYIALREPFIQAPQLRELGDATPPLEWFGVNRKKFPGLTHQFVILTLQRLVHEIELQYERVLGRA